jgi:hypothetical protein
MILKAEDVKRDLDFIESSLRRLRFYVTHSISLQFNPPFSVFVFTIKSAIETEYP